MQGGIRKHQKRKEIEDKSTWLTKKRRHKSENKEKNKLMKEKINYNVVDLTIVT